MPETVLEPGRTLGPVRSPEGPGVELDPGTDVVGTPRPGHCDDLRDS
ncbi:hypothetical protein [Halomicrococcus sp. NG-SE-24]